MRPRSSLALKQGVTILNSPGTVDADYRGELKVLLINHGDQSFAVRRGERVAQLVIAPTTQVSLQEADEIIKADYENKKPSDAENVKKTAELKTKKKKIRKK